MEIEKLLHGVDCTCGRRHSCDIRYVYIEHGAAARLAGICREYRTVLLVADENTYAVAGADTERALAGKTVRKVVFPGDTLLVPDEQAIAAAQQELDGADVIVGVGAGVIQDLCKYVSHQSGIPYLVVATAPSMDGYASDGAAMITGGMKVTYACHMPLAIVADPAVLAAAPMDMLQAGYGDIIGKFSALNDWKLSHCVNGEYLCPFIYDLTMEQVHRVLALAEGIVRRDEAAVGALMGALVIVGIMMSFAGSSRPASGSEHHLSHFFEITGILNGTPYFPHGIDVAYSTVVTAEVRQRILSHPLPERIYRPTRAQLEATVSRIYGTSAPGCLALQDKVGNYAADRLPIFRAKEQEIRAILAEMPSPQEIRDMLALVGLDMQAFYDQYGASHIADAVLYAKELKDRYTVLWMNYDFFGGATDVR
ncbi:MAG: sn-glycerol-1-phosphate dehydrogenase [Oscillospiraceae bacterium]|nr:sn-glycerol-1-phosphate dehydrogenase [Oscillospiraceae bacterium]